MLLAILECVPGYGSDGSGGCTICPEGSFKNATSNDNCTQCDPLTQTTDGTGKLSESDCGKLFFFLSFFLSFFLLSLFLSLPCQLL